MPPVPPIPPRASRPSLEPLASSAEEVLNIWLEKVDWTRRGFTPLPDERLSSTYPFINSSSSSSGSPAEGLPNEVLTLIFSILPIEDRLFTVPAVCKRWKEQAEMPECYLEADCQEWTELQTLLIKPEPPATTTSSSSIRMFKESSRVDTVLKKIARLSCGETKLLRAWNASSAGLDAMAGSRPSLLHLEMPDAVGSLDDALSRLLSFSRSLRNFTVRPLYRESERGGGGGGGGGGGAGNEGGGGGGGGYAITDTTLYALSAFCPLLTHLDIAECCGVTRGGICAVLQHCHHLTSLNLEGCLVRPDDSVHVLLALVRNCRDLRALNLANCALEEEAVSLLVMEEAALPKLSSLVLNLVDPLPLSTIESLGRSLHLRELVVGWNEWFGNEEALVVGHTCPQLTALDISWTSVSDPGMKAIATSCTKLQRLVATCTKITDAAVETIVENCKDMKQLCLKRCLTTDRSLAAIARSSCRDLTGLWLYGVYETSCFPPMLTLADLHHLFTKCPRICELTLRLFDLSSCPSSSTLDSTDSTANRALTRGRRTFRCAPFFRSLALLRRSLRGVSLVADPNWFFIDLRTEMFQFLRLCPKLVRFGVKNCKEMTDQLCGEMGAACPGLEHVTFAGCTNLTVEGLKLLVSRCRRLKSIDISKCEAIQAGVGPALQGRLPNRRVVMINPTIESVCGLSWPAETR